MTTAMDSYEKKLTRARAIEAACKHDFCAHACLAVCLDCYDAALAAARAEGYRAGQERMRERCEAARELEWVKCPTPGGDHMNALGTFAPHNCPVCAPIEPEGGE